MESTLEALVWSLILESGVRLPERQYRVDVPGGRYRLDFCWPDLMFGLECDGYEHHGERKSDWGKDRARYAELAVIGLRVMPVTWDVARHRAEACAPLAARWCPRRRLRFIVVEPQDVVGARDSESVHGDGADDLAVDAGEDLVEASAR